MLKNWGICPLCIAVVYEKHKKEIFYRQFSINMECIYFFIYFENNMQI